MKQFLDILYQNNGKSNPDTYIQFDVIFKKVSRACLLSILERLWLSRYISFVKNRINTTRLASYLLIFDRKSHCFSLPLPKY